MSLPDHTFIAWYITYGLPYLCLFVLLPIVTLSLLPRPPSARTTVDDIMPSHASDEMNPNLIAMKHHRDLILAMFKRGATVNDVADALSTTTGLHPIGLTHALRHTYPNTSRSSTTRNQ